VKPAERNAWIVTFLALVFQGGQFYVQHKIPGITPTDRNFAIVIAHESGTDTDKIGTLFTQLRTGAFATYCQQKGHRCRILDKDAVDENGQRVIAEVDLAGKQLPLVLLYDATTKKLVNSEPLTSLTVDAVMNVVRNNGG